MCVCVFVARAKRQGSACIELSNATERGEQLSCGMVWCVSILCAEDRVKSIIRVGEHSARALHVLLPPAQHYEESA